MAVAPMVLIQVLILVSLVVNGPAATWGQRPLTNLMVTFVPYAGAVTLVCSSLAMSCTAFATFLGFNSLSDGIFVWYTAGVLQSQLQEDGVRSTIVSVFAVRAARPRREPPNLTPIYTPPLS